MGSINVAIIGVGNCASSHGFVATSPTDREVATNPWDVGPMYPVQQLVVGIDKERVVEAALFAWSDEADEFVEIARFKGDAV